MELLSDHDLEENLKEKQEELAKLIEPGEMQNLNKELLFPFLISQHKMQMINHLCPQPVAYAERALLNMPWEEPHNLMKNETRSPFDSHARENLFLYPQITYNQQQLIPNFPNCTPQISFKHDFNQVANWPLSVQQVCSNISQQTSHSSETHQNSLQVYNYGQQHQLLLNKNRFMELGRVSYHPDFQPFKGGNISPYLLNHKLDILPLAQGYKENKYTTKDISDHSFRHGPIKNNKKKFQNLTTNSLEIDPKLLNMKVTVDELRRGRPFPAPPSIEKALIDKFNNFYTYITLMSKERANVESLILSEERFAKLNPPVKYLDDVSAHLSYAIGCTFVEFRAVKELTQYNFGPKQTLKGALTVLVQDVYVQNQKLINFRNFLHDRKMSEQHQMKLQEIDEVLTALITNVRYCASVFFAIKVALAKENASKALPTKQRNIG